MDENKKRKLRFLVAISSIFGSTSYLIIFVILAAALFILGIFTGDDSNSIASNDNCVNYQTVDEVCKSITVNGETMSVDDYVAGVVEHEFGSTALEVKKAQAIAARSYGIAGATKDDNGNCDVGNASESFQTYSSTPSETSIQAAQETSGVVLVDSDGKIARSEYSSNSLPEPYDSFGDTITMSERNLEIPREWFSTNKTCDADTLNTVNKHKDTYGRPVYGCGHGRGMGQIAAKYLYEEKGYTYEEILEFFYGEDSEYKWKLGSSSGGQTGNCNSSSGGFEPLSSYNFGHANLKILNRTLTDSERDKLNSYINTEVDKAGYGTGDAVAAAGQALVHGLEQMGYYLGYCYGGDRSSLGVGKTWGTVSDKCNSPTNTHIYYGMDCSGFVDWAIRNACKSSQGGDTTFDMEYGPHISIDKAKPGDLMLNTISHVRLVIKNNGDGTVITAEEGGSYGDLSFAKVGPQSGYNFIDMSSWYKKNCSDTNPTTGVQRGQYSSDDNSSSSSTNDKLKKQIESYIKNNAASGSWTVYFKNLKNNDIVSIDASKQMNSASIIKLFVLGAVYDKVNSKQITESSIKEDARIMINRSDNGATNRLIDKVGGFDVVNKYISSSNYSSNTKLNRYLGGNYTDSGINNYTTAKDVGILLEKIYRGTMINKTYSDTMLGFMKEQVYRSKIPAGVPNGTVANKTGEIRGVQNDSAIVYTKGADYILVVMSSTGSEDSGVKGIKDISRIVYDFYN